MKVKELISKLTALPQDRDVLCYSEDGGLLEAGHIFKLFELTSVNLSEGQKTRGEDGVASLKFGSSKYSEPHVLIEITSDF